MRVILTFLIMLFEFIATPAQADIYRYIDETGHSVYVDNLAAVPAQHRQKFIDEQGERGESVDSTTDLTTQDSTDGDLRWQELIARHQTEIHASAWPPHTGANHPTSSDRSRSNRLKERKGN